jgi:hypothetical protein
VLRTGAAQRGGLSRRDLATALATRPLDRGRRTVWDDVGLEEGPARQLPHRGGLPLHRDSDGRVRRGRPGGLAVCLDRAAVALLQGAALLRLARHRISVLFAMLRSGTFYEPWSPRLA